MEPLLAADDRLHARVLYANRLELWSWWRFPRMCDPYWRLYWHDQDGAALIHHDRPLALARERAVLVPAEVAVGTRPAPGVRQLYAHIDLIGLPEAVRAACFDQPWVAPADPVLSGLLAPLMGTGPAAPPPLAVLSTIKAAFFRALGLWVAALPPDAAGAGAVRGAGRTAACLRAIGDEPGALWTVPRLAAIAGLSPSRFARVFLAEVGVPPARYLQERRLEAAAHRLRHGDEPIPDLARSLGYRDRHYFTRAFTRRFGMAPATFRRTAREQRPPAGAAAHPVLRAP
jgi:AraC-like DNA-binding protein